MAADEKVVLHEEEIGRALTRIAHEILERNATGPAPALVGIHRRGAFLARRLHPLLEEILGAEVPLGDLDIGFYRDDVATRLDAPVLHASHIDFDVTGLTVVIVDDVLFTGRTVRAAIEALFAYGRPAARAAVGARRSRPPRAADPPGLRRQEPADLELRARVRAPARAGRRGRGSHSRDHHGRGGDMNHLISIEDLERADIERIVTQAERFAEVSDREIKTLPTLRGRMVLNLFYEASTRTRGSFELAAKRLSADVVNFVASGSSVEKGESLKDTVLTLSAHKPDAIVLRTPWAGAAELVSGWCSAAIVNAGDGKHEHPTQALLDVYTLRRHLGAIDGASIWIVGDVAHSRVARSNVLAFQRMGAKVTVAGPPTLIPRGIEELGCEVRYTLDELGEANVVYALRMQHERMNETWVPSMREYAAWYQINGRRLAPHQMLMHPGPVNRGVELSGEVVDSPQAVITAQVQAGVVVRMAVLYELLAGRDAHPPARALAAAAGGAPDSERHAPAEPVAGGRVA